MHFPKSQIFPNCSWDNFSNGKMPVESAIPAVGSPLFFLQLRKDLSAYHGTCLDQVFIGFPVPENWLVISSCASPSPPFGPAVLSLAQSDSQNEDVLVRIQTQSRLRFARFCLVPMAGTLEIVSLLLITPTFAANTPTLSNTQTQRSWLLLLAGSWRGQNCLSRMAAHGLFLCSFLPADQNKKLSKCDGENLHFNIPPISVCSSATVLLFTLPSKWSPLRSLPSRRRIEEWLCSSFERRKIIWPGKKEKKENLRRWSLLWSFTGNIMNYIFYLLGPPCCYAVRARMLSLLNFQMHSTRAETSDSVTDVRN